MTQRPGSDIPGSYTHPLRLNSAWEANERIDRGSQKTVMCRDAVACSHRIGKKIFDRESGIGKPTPIKKIPE
jgi:hypothetical protein